MKKHITLLLSIALLLSLCACVGANSPSADSDKIPSIDNATKPISSDAAADTTSDTTDDTAGIDVDITEKLYVTYINEIYTNTEDYIGKTIRIQGMFSEEYYAPTESTYYYVYRTGPGCCGNDGSMCGFEFSYDGDYPAENDWIEVVGTLQTYEEGGCSYLALDATSVTVMDTRGAETVYQ